MKLAADIPLDPDTSDLTAFPGGQCAFTAPDLMPAAPWRSAALFNSLMQIDQDWIAAQPYEIRRKSRPASISQMMAMMAIIHAAEPELLDERWDVYRNYPFLPSIWDPETSLFSLAEIRRQEPLSQVAIPLPGLRFAHPSYALASDLYVELAQIYLRLAPRRS